MKNVSLLLALSFALLLSGCGGMIKGKAAADAGVAEFHRRYNEGKLTEIYTASHAKLKAATKEQEFMDFEQAVQKKLGKVTNTSNANFNIKSYNFVTSVVLIQTTTFEHGSGQETFTFQMDGDKAVLVGYYINSKDLILK